MVVIAVLEYLDLATILHCRFKLQYPVFYEAILLASALIIGGVVACSDNLRGMTCCNHHFYKPSTPYYQGYYSPLSGFMIFEYAPVRNVFI